MENTESSSSTDELTEDYWLDNYGTCKVDDKCFCRSNRCWLGRMCPNWEPLGAKSFEDLQRLLKG